MTLSLIISAISGYLIGSINTSIVVSKFKKNDIRNHGSGNAGATNTLRVMGKTVAALVLFGDALKAVVAILLAQFIANKFQLGADVVAYCKYVAAFCVILGHNYPLYFGFRGGKGIFSSVAVMFALDWRIGLIVTLVGILQIVLTRYVSLGSITGCILYPLFCIAFYSGDAPTYMKMQVILAVLMGGLGVLRHRSNIKKIMQGTESKIGEKSKQ